MDPRALELLELPEILDRLAAAAASEPGRGRALALRPSGDDDEVAARQLLTSEAIALLEQSAEPDLAGIRDVRPLVEVAGRGGVLDTGALHAIRVTVEAALAARAALDAADGVPTLSGLAGAVDPGLAAPAEAIGKAVEADGTDLRDGASPALRRLRRELREGRARLAER